MSLLPAGLIRIADGKRFALALLLSACAIAANLGVPMHALAHTALAATAAPAGATPAPGSSPASTAFFKHATGFDSEADGFMDYTDDVLL